MHVIAASEVTKATVFMKLKLIKNPKLGVELALATQSHWTVKGLLMVACQNGQTLPKICRISLSLLPYLASGSVIVNVDPAPRVLTN